MMDSMLASSAPDCSIQLRTAVTMERWRSLAQHRLLFLKCPESMSNALSKAPPGRQDHGVGLHGA